MGVVTSFTPDSSFWELNPQLLLEGTFKAFHKADKSRSKTESSLILWWIAFCYDMDPDNKWRGQPLHEKHAALGEELLGDSDYYQNNQKKVQPLIDAYVKLTDTPAKAALRDWEAKMLERREFIKETKYTLGDIGEKGGWVGGTAAILDTMFANTKKIFDDYELIVKKLSTEAAEGQGKGGSTSSISDSGEI